MMLSILLALALQTSSNKLPPAQALPPPAVSDEANVLASIDRVFAAMSAGDFARLLTMVDPDGRVTAVGALRSGSGIRRQSFAQFIAHQTQGQGFQESITDPAVEIDGDVAMVWAPFVVRVGGKVSNCGYDHFDLIRENGAWKIENITFSSRMTGCPAQ
jgi:ketosteroid isomerase-like protein